MNNNWIYYLGIILLIVFILVIILLIQRLHTFLSKNQNQGVALDRIELQLRSESKSNRSELAEANTQLRKEINDAFTASNAHIRELLARFNEYANGMHQQFNVNARDSRQEQQVSLNQFGDKFTQGIKDFNDVQHFKFSDLARKQEGLRLETEQKLELIRQTIEQKLATLQQDNLTKLDEIRRTVDEKLNATLEKRFNQSFQLIAERLELVHKGLGEMQHLATNVGDLKRVMSNVKTRGVLGEYQLANLLEDLLTNEQYEKNVKTKEGSGAIVEFAIKMPHGSEENKTLWLPIDSKFPKEDFEALQDAYDEADPSKVDHYRKSFRAAIIKNAREIREKYIDPPNTTDYGIMFLPYESLYAEVLRTQGLFDTLQREHKITVTGPATLSALLNSLQMGFRTLAIQKRSSEVWTILATIKKDFGKFGDLLEKTKRKLEETTRTIDEAGQRSRLIEKRLLKVQELPTGDIEVLGNPENLIQGSLDDLLDIESSEDNDPDNFK